MEGARPSAPAQARSGRIKGKEMTNMFIGGLLLLFLIAFVVLFIIFAIIKAVIKISLGLLFGFPVIGAIVIVVIVAAILL